MLLFKLALVAQAQDCNTSRDVLLVGVEHTPPFAMNVDGDWQGISVDLWERIADQYDWQYQYVPGEFQNMLKATSNCELDVVLPAITITPEREKLLDFSASYLVEEVAIATNLGKSGWTVTKEVLWSLTKPICLLLVALTFAGTVYWILETDKRKLNLRGYFDSNYWAMTTMVTVGYGDEAPKAYLGRTFAMFWMFVSLFISATINAQVLGAFNNVSWIPEIDDVSDLKGHEVITVADSFSDKLLNSNQIPHRVVASEEQMFELFSDKKSKIDFVVYDRSILKYNLDADITILERGIYDQHLGLAVRPNFELLEEINLGVLSTINTNWWKTTVFEYTHK